MEEIFRMVLALSIVLLLAWGGIWALKQLRGQKSAGNRLANLTVEQSLQLGPREKLAIVRVGESRLLIGVTSNQIALLQALPDGRDSSGAVSARQETQDSV